MPSRFTQYGGVAGAEGALREMVAERLMAEAAQQKAQQQEFENQMRRRQLSQGDARIDLDRARLDYDMQPEAPKPQGPMSVGANQRLVDPTSGRIIVPEVAEQPKPAGPMNVGPGSVIADPTTGRIIFKNPQAAGGPASEPGWSIQQVSDPKTNTTSLMRVNSRTGQAEPINLPGGMQPGGQRQARLTAGQQDELATMKTVEDMTTQAETIGNEIDWKGVGGLGTGSAASFMARNLGYGTEKEEGLRNLIGNIQGTIAKLRGGTSFTANEQKLLETYTPTINDSDLTIKTKLKSLRDFIATKRANTLQFAGADMGTAEQPATAGPQGGGGQEFDYVPGKGLVPRGAK